MLQSNDKKQFKKIDELTKNRILPLQISLIAQKKPIIH